MTFRFCLYLIGLAWSIQASPIHFIFVGDTGTGTSDQYRVASAMKTYCTRDACDFLVLLGDNFYPGGVSSVLDPQWQTKVIKPYEPLNIPLYPVLGNHDYLGNVSAQLNFSKIFSHWILPARYHTFTRGMVQFFILDSNKMDSAQLTWLKTELNGSAARWKIAAEHHPLYSYGVHGSDENLINTLRPLLLGRLDFFLVGHDHDKQVLKDPSDSFLHYVVAGTGSQNRPSKGGVLSQFNSSTLGFGSLNLDDETAALKMLNANAEIEFEKRISHR